MGVFPAADSADEHGIVVVGGDLRPDLLLSAYSEGLFPMPHGEHLVWWSPDPRAVLPAGGIRVSRTLRRTRRRYAIRWNTAFAAVVDGCADPTRPHGWITQEVCDAYLRLHELGWAHSIEAWDADGRLVGGVYGVAIGRLFAAESMFHRAPDAGKAALAALGERLGPEALIDVQWLTPHLASLGAVEIPRAEYLQRLAGAVTSA
ncbi:MAG: leucyl/phenylalanyl-tRNA--protein transferase [Solirubrobacteraceae bacterium]